MRGDFQTECLPPAGGIDCDEAELLVSRRLDGELDAADAPLLDAHLNVCPHCRAVLESWSEQEEALEESLQSLWKPDPVPVPIPPIKQAVVVRPPRGAWLPMGMAASQVLALGGLAIYFLFFGSPASAPQATAMQPKTVDLKPVPAPEVASPSEAPAQPVDVKIVISSQTDQVQLSVVTVPAPASGVPQASRLPGLVEEISRPHGGEESRRDACGTAPQEIVMAAPRSNGPPKEIANLVLTYRLVAEDGEIEQSGRVVLLGDILRGQGVVRFVDSSGKTRDVAQADVATLVPPALREIVRSFISECTRPDVRARLLSAQGRGE